MAAQATATQFSNMQLELLKIYARNVSDEDLMAIKDLMAQYFAKKATALANKAWEEKGLDAELILNSHHRTPYPKNNR